MQRFVVDTRERVSSPSRNRPTSLVFDTRERHGTAKASLPLDTRAGVVATWLVGTRCPSEMVCPEEGATRGSRVKDAEEAMCPTLRKDALEPLSPIQGHERDGIDSCSGVRLHTGAQPRRQGERRRGLRSGTLTQATEEVGISGTDRCIPVALEDGAEHGRRASCADSECTLAPVLTKRSESVPRTQHARARHSALARTVLSFCLSFSLSLFLSFSLSRSSC